MLVFILKGEIPLLEGIAVIGGILLLNAIILSAFYYATLETRISPEGIEYRWWPFFKKFRLISWNDVDHVAMRKYSSLQFGYHKHKEFGKVHNVDGVHGFQVVMSNGKKYFFGTQQKLSVESVLQQTGKMRL